MPDSRVGSLPNHRRAARRKGASLAIALTLLGQLLAVIVPPAVAAVDDGATIAAGTWSVDGPAVAETPTAVLTRDGTGGLVRLDYDYQDPGHSTQTWFLSTVAQDTGTIVLDWRYTGFHAWFDVDVYLEAFHISGESGDTAVSLVDAHAANNSSGEPTGGFDYDGTFSFDVVAGDTFGFELGGRNFDSNNVLQGALQVGLNTVTNGSFEQPDVLEAWDTFPAGSEGIPGWDVTNGTVDIVTEPHWGAPDGVQVLDLDGDVIGEGPYAGTIRQTVESVAGVQYRIQAQYSGNPDCGNLDDLSAGVIWEGERVETLVHDSVANSEDRSVESFDYYDFEALVTASGSAGRAAVRLRPGAELDVRHRP